ncbi:MAG: hypothetical protein FJ271_06085 [Planctomycetes bacterium]|nr:hypothetical protein [Planctomycetota bacterium]
MPPANDRSVCLGIFVLGQLLLLVMSNATSVLHDLHAHLSRTAGGEAERLAPGWTGKEGHAWQASQALAALGNRWGELTGQTQGWSLFAPGVSAECVFPAVRLLRDVPADSAAAIAGRLLPLAADDPLATLTLYQIGRGGDEPMMPAAAEDWLSDNEPRDIDAFFRIGDFRLRRFEGALALVLTESPDESPESRASRWRGEIAKFVSSHSANIHAYLRWRSAQLPGGTDARQVILLMRRFHITEPEEPSLWQGPFVMPVARWQPRASWSADYGQVEMFNPVTRRFEGVLK